MRKKISVTGVIAGAIIVMLLSSCMPAHFTPPTPAMPTSTPEPTPLPATAFYHFDSGAENWDAAPSSVYCAVTRVAHNSNTAYTYLGSPGSLLCPADIIDMTCNYGRVGVTITPSADMTGRRVSARIYYAGVTTNYEIMYLTISIHTPDGLFGQFYIYPVLSSGWFEAGYTPKNITVTAVDRIEVQFQTSYVNGHRDLYIDEVKY